MPIKRFSLKGLYQDFMVLGYEKMSVITVCPFRPALYKGEEGRNFS